MKKIITGMDVIMGLSAITVNQQHRICLIRFIPLFIKTGVFAGTVPVMRIHTHSIPVKYPKNV